REEVALAELAAKRAQRSQLVDSLDPFRDDLQSECLGELDDRPDEHRAFAVCPEAVDERSIDLEDVDGEAIEIAQRRVASAEVVDGEPDAVRSQLAEGVDSR